ncbi:MAG: hypothetical protein WA632_05460 [Gallionella sp.]
MPFIALLASYLLVSYYSVAEGKYISEFVDTLYQSKVLSSEQKRSDDNAVADNDVVSHKYSDCMKAFGNTKFCQCLRDKTPEAIDFRDYVKVLTTPKAGLGYADADKNMQVVIDNTLKIGEVCRNVAEQ